MKVLVYKNIIGDMNHYALEGFEIREITSYAEILGCNVVQILDAPLCDKTSNLYKEVSMHIKSRFGV